MKINNDEYYVLVAWNFVLGKAEFEALDDINDFNLDDKIKIDGIVLYQPPTQESELLKKEAYNNLSSEAKRIINLILDSPPEVISEINSSTYDMLSKRKIKMFLNKNGMKRKNRLKVFIELRKYCANF
jgi:hypothetical protein